MNRKLYGDEIVITKTILRSLPEIYARRKKRQKEIESLAYPSMQVSEDKVKTDSTTSKVESIATMLIEDKKLRLMNELIQGIEVIFNKLPVLQKKIIADKYFSESKLRNKELAKKYNLAYQGVTFAEGEAIVVLADTAIKQYPNFCEYRNTVRP